MLRAILNARWKDHISNVKLYEDMPKFTEIIKKTLKFAGHFWRSEGKAVRNVLFWQPNKGKIKKKPRKKTTCNSWRKPHI